MKITGSFVAVAICTAVLACSHENAQSVAPATTAETGSSATACPVARLNGVDVTVADIPDGISLAFTGPSERVPELRAHVRAMDEANARRGDAFSVCACADRYRRNGSVEALPESASAGAQWNQAAFGASGPQGPSPSSDASGPGVTSMQGDADGLRPGAASIRAMSSVDLTPTGATLDLRASDPRQAQALRDRTRMDERALQAGCMGTPVQP